MALRPRVSKLALIEFESNLKIFSKRSAKRTTKSFESQYLGNIFDFFDENLRSTQNEMVYSLDFLHTYRFFLHLLTAGDRTFFTDKIVITEKNY